MTYKDLINRLAANLKQHPERQRLMVAFRRDELDSLMRSLLSMAQSIDLAQRERQRGTKLFLVDALKEPMDRLYESLEKAPDQEASAWQQQVQQEARRRQAIRCRV